MRKTKSALAHLRAYGFRATLAVALLRLADLLVTRPACRLRAGRARLFGMRLGRNARIDGTAKITGHARIAVGHSFFLGLHCQLKSLIDLRRSGGPNLLIGNNVLINDGTIIDANYLIDIGDNTRVGPQCLIIDTNHVFADAARPICDQGTTGKPVIISKDCWIAGHVVILPGVTIGEHSVVAANSTVTRDVPPFALVAGSPAAIIHRL